MSASYQTKLAGLLSLLIIGQTATLPVFASARATDLGPLEDKFFAHQYDKEAVEARLDRLEKMVFGKSQPGSNEERIARLSSTVSSAGVLPSKPASSQKQAPKIEDSASRAAGKASAQADNFDYPAVAQLERSLLGKSYKGDPVQQRLCRLETKAFGAPSKIEDMASRVDKLSNYAATYGMQPGDDKLYATNSSRAGANQSNSFGWNRGGYAGSNSVASNADSFGSANGMLDRVGALETKEFGAPSTSQPLIHRIKKLEDKVYGKALSNNEDMTARVDKLWAAVKPDAYGSGGLASNQSSAPPFSSSKKIKSHQAANNWAADPANNNYTDSFNNNTAYNPSSGYAAPYGSGNNSYYGSTNKHHKQKSPSSSSSHGSILGKIGKVAVFAGSAALGAGAVAAGAMGGGGYGGYGYGGYGSYSPYRSYSSFGSYGSPFASSYGGSFFSR